MNDDIWQTKQSKKYGGDIKQYLLHRTKAFYTASDVFLLLFIMLPLVVMAIAGILSFPLGYSDAIANHIDYVGVVASIFGVLSFCVWFPAYIICVIMGERTRTMLNKGYWYERFISSQKYRLGCAEEIEKLLALSASARFCKGTAISHRLKEIKQARKVYARFYLSKSQYHFNYKLEFYTDVYVNAFVKRFNKTKKALDKEKMNLIKEIDYDLKREV